MPWSSTGIGLIARPAAPATSRARCQHGSSTATAWQPARRSARQMRPIPSVALAQMVRCLDPPARLWPASGTPRVPRGAPGALPDRGIRGLLWTGWRRPSGPRPPTGRPGMPAGPAGRAPCRSSRSPVRWQAAGPRAGQGWCRAHEHGYRAGPRLHVARPGELRVGLGYHPARAPEVCRQDAARRQQAAGGSREQRIASRSARASLSYSGPEPSGPRSSGNAGTEIGLVIMHVSGS